MILVQSLLVNLAAIMVAMLVLWQISVAIKDVSFIDAVWAYGMVGLTLLTAAHMPGSPVDAAAILSAAREKLAGYKVPHHVRFVDVLPISAQGKVLKWALRDLAQQDNPA